MGVPPEHAAAVLASQVEAECSSEGPSSAATLGGSGLPAVPAPSEGPCPGAAVYHSPVPLERLLRATRGPSGGGGRAKGARRAQ